MELQCGGGWSSIRRSFQSKRYDGEHKPDYVGFYCHTHQMFLSLRDLLKLGMQRNFYYNPKLN